jgi:glyoxylase I family protein
MSKGHPEFTFEHAALNLKDADQVSAAERWYTRHLCLRTVRRTPSGAIFLADPTGRVVLELYANPAAPALDLPAQHFLSFHLAFLSADPEETARRLVSAGATIAEAAKEVNGDRMIMLRDPFGVCLQLMRRREPLFG